MNADTPLVPDAALLQQMLGLSMARGMAVAFWARVMPQAAAVVADAGSTSFAELNARCNQLVRALRERGLKAGDGVALMCSNRILRLRP